MTASTSASFRVLLYEGAGGGAAVPDSLRFDLMRTLLEKGYTLACVREGGSVSDSNDGVILVLGFFGNGSVPKFREADRITIHFRDISGADVPTILNHVESVRAEANAYKSGNWKPWFPVIDYGRCTNCMQCLSFCLFDVYGVSSENKIQVQNQNNCKTDCPACSRVCPEVAILFPKYRHGPINGDEVNAEDLRRESMKVDISSLLGGDIYQALRDRSERAKSRFSKERDEERALKERTRCLEKLKAIAADVPPEVLSALPSPDQIRAKAEKARAAGQAALAAAAGSASQPQS